MRELGERCHRDIWVSFQREGVKREEEGEPGFDGSDTDPKAIYSLELSSRVGGGGFGG